MHIDDRFASRANHIDETPEPLRSALRPHLDPKAPPRLLVFGPRFVTAGQFSPASLLAIGDRGWIVALEDEGGGTLVVQCFFEDTLLLELTSIVLYGRLRLDFIAGNRAQSTAMEFNVVMDWLFKEAVNLILDGVAATIAPGVEPHEDADADAHERATAAALEEFPFKFRNMVPKSLPRGRRLLGAVYLAAIKRGFGRELAPAAVLAATQHELILVSEEPSHERWHRKPQAKIGTIDTYFPLSRLARYHLIRQERFDVLDLEVHASHGGERFSIIFPPEEEVILIQFIDRIMHQQIPPKT